MALRNGGIRLNQLFPLEVSVLSSDALSTHLSNEYFSRTQLKCRLFSRGLHDVYKIWAGDQTYFYKVYRQGVRSKAEIQSELDLLLHLKAADLAVNLPVGKHDGTYISEFHTANGVRYGVLYTSVGMREFSHIEETPESNEKLGAYIASVHTAWDRCDAALNRWDLDASTFLDRSLEAARQFSEVHDFDLDFLEEVGKQVKNKLKGLPTETPQFGICHGDFYSGNVRVDAEHNPILIDFDFCGKGWRAYDISMYAYPFGMGSDVANFPQRERRKEQFLNGYNKVRAMSEAEVDSIALFIPFRRIFNIGTLYITYLTNTWGHSTVTWNVDSDVDMLKKWVDLNPIFS
ncbi:phosphotransferase [Gorillibacterium sp. CAU 1737]|uniref:phosphotransferase enzyme family protein n=1 Tax=Gorillibacterium sp. CAU 1737 TaxID=3140362 RepID=UPI003260ABDD